MLNRLDQTPWPYPSVTWDVIKGSRMVAKPNVPNSEAHVIGRLGRQPGDRGLYLPAGEEGLRADHPALAAHPR